MQIRDKGTFKRLQQAGLLGNYFRMWDSVAALRAAEYHGWLTVRARRASDRKLFIPAIHSTDVYQLDGKLYAGMRGHHCALADVYLQECPAPSAGRIINLEAMRGYSGSRAQDAGLYVRYALNDPTNLRHSLEQRGVDAHGLTAWNVLKWYLREDLDQLLDIWTQHPDAVIEASRFSRRVGVFDSQTVIWEAREF